MKLEKLIKLAAFLVALTDRGLSYSLSAKKRSGAFCFHKGKLVLLPLLLMGLLTLPHCGDNGDSSSNGGGNSPSPDPPPSPSPDPSPIPGPPPSPDPSPIPNPSPSALCSADADAGTGFNGGDGSEGDPYIICTYEQLAMIEDDLAVSYQLASTIDADSEDDWVPIGDADTPFAGSLDGGGYSIRNLTMDIEIDSGAAYGGLFGYIGSSAVISNIALRDVSITIESLDGSSFFTCVGGLVGYNDGGTISNSYAAGPDASISTLSNASTSIADDSRVGGLVGFNNGGTINNSYAGVSVKAIASITSGSSIEAGGLVGRHEGGTINNSYATGHPTCGDTGSCGVGLLLGGLVGYLHSGTISDSYWDTDTGTGTGLDDGCGDVRDVGSPPLVCPDALTFGLTTAQMKNGTSAALGLGFQISAGSYPKLYLCEIDSTTNACSGSFSTELLPGQ